MGEKREKRGNGMRNECTSPILDSIKVLTCDMDLLLALEAGARSRIHENRKSKIESGWEDPCGGYRSFLEAHWAAKWQHEVLVQLFCPATRSFGQSRCLNM